MRAVKRDQAPVPIELVKATSSADIVVVPRRRCLAIDGAGAPSEARFAAAIGALYGTAYTLKFTRKRSARSDFKVGPMEGHWSADVARPTKGIPPADRWRWRLRIGVPSDVTKADVERIKRAVVTKKKGKLEGSPVVEHIFLELVPAQRVGRILHLGPYGEEPASFAIVDSLLGRAKLTPAPTHIEVYLNDPQRTSPAALKTVLLRELTR